MIKKTKLKCRSGDTVTVHVNPELVFRRALVLANCREDVTVEKVLSFPIGPIPTSLFHDDGTMRTTSKADLAQQLKQDVSIIQTLPIFDIFRTTLIRDGIPLLQSINAKRVRTFGEMALDIKKIRSLAFSWHPLSSISLIDMTFKTLSKRQNGTVDPSLFSLQKCMR
jgi:hypothetical protein